MQSRTISKETFFLVRKIIMIGAGGHAKVLLSLLRESGGRVDTVVTPDFIQPNSPFFDLPKLNSDADAVEKLDPDGCILVNGIGPMPHLTRRRDVFEKFVSRGFIFKTIVSTNAKIAHNVVLYQGAQVMNGVVLQPDVVIGANTLINTGSIVDHDCDIGAHNHIAPGAVLCGGVKTGVNVFVCSGSVVTEQIQVGQSAVVGAGASIVRDVPPSVTVMPAKIRISERDVE